MTMQLIIGIDPGIAGALLMLADGEPSGFIDMPTIERKGGGQMVDGRMLAGLLRGAIVQHRGAYVFAALERVRGIRKGPDAPKQSVSHTFNFGQSDGIVRGVLGSLSIPLVEVESQTWKRKYGFLGREKDYPREVALGAFPALANDLKLKKHGGRADALWIAKWARETDQVGKAA